MQRGNWTGAKIALLLPTDGSDFQKACQIADNIDIAKLDSGSLAEGSLVKALAELRRGRFEEAKNWAAAPDAKDCRLPSPQHAEILAVQAAACAQLGQTEASRSALDSADSRLGKPSKYDFLWNWGEWTIAELLDREARELIDKPPAAQP